VSASSTAARELGAPRSMRRRRLRLAGAAIAAIALIGYVIVARAPTYDPPRDDEISILLELAGVFPDKYAIEWREHASLTSADAEAQRDPGLLHGASFTHSLRSATDRSEGKVYVEAAYSYFTHDHAIDVTARSSGSRERVPGGHLSADAAVYGCWCDSQSAPSTPTRCDAALGFGNYEFSLSIDYNVDRCSAQIATQRREEFLRAVLTADQLIRLYLEPLRRKPRWL
jgi:hypothetical protein